MFLYQLLCINTKHSNNIEIVGDSCYYSLNNIENYY